MNAQSSMEPFEYLSGVTDRNVLTCALVDRMPDGTLLVFYSSTCWILESTQYVFKIKLPK